MGALDEILGRGQKFVVAGFHALLRERACVFDAAVRVAVDDAARAEVFAEVREVLCRRIVAQLRFLLWFNMKTHFQWS